MLWAAMWFIRDPQGLSRFSVGTVASYSITVEGYSRSVTLSVPAGGCQIAIGFSVNLQHQAMRRSAQSRILTGCTMPFNIHARRWTYASKSLRDAFASTGET
jgi:hypothetical protein